MTPAAGKLAEHAVNLRDEAKARADRTNRLKFTFGHDGDVYLNVADHRDCQSVDAFTGPFAKNDAYQDAEDSEARFQDGESHGIRYRTTIILHPNGTWEERHLLPL